MAATSTEIHTPARCLVAKVAEEEHHDFFVATCSLRGSNEVKLLRYNEDTEDLTCVALYHHSGEVLSLGSCAADGSLLTTVYDSAGAAPGGGPRGTLWRTPPLPVGAGAGGGGGGGARGGGEPPAQELVALADVPAVPGWALAALVWTPPAAEGLDPRHVLAVYDRGLRVFAVAPDAGGGAGALRAAGGADFEDDAAGGEGGGGGPGVHFGGAAWDPHHPGEVAVALDGAVHVHDVRSGEHVRTLATVGGGGGVVRGLSFNPNRPWHLATAGDDFRVKVWDVRRPGAPLKVLEGHAHWATAVAFNPFHDQLLASGGGDGRVVLWRVSSVSSAPLLELGEADGGAPEGGGGGAGDAPAAPGGEGAGASASSAKLAADVAVRVHDEHEETVTAIAWSGRSAWVAATLSYTGRVTVLTVPSGEKYRILL